MTSIDGSCGNKEKKVITKEAFTALFDQLRDSFAENSKLKSKYENIQKELEEVNRKKENIKKAQLAEKKRIEEEKSPMMQKINEFLPPEPEGNEGVFRGKEPVLVRRRPKDNEVVDEENKAGEHYKRRAYMRDFLKEMEALYPGPEFQQDRKFLNGLAKKHGLTYN